MESILEKLTQEVKLKLGPLKNLPSGWQKQNCKLCHLRGHSSDTRERFGIRFESDGTIGMNCFNCRFSAAYSPGKTLSKDFQWFLGAIGFSNYDVKRYTFEIYKLRHNIQSNDKEIKFKKNAIDKWKPDKLPKESKTILEWANSGCKDKSFIEAVKYLKSRSLLYPSDFYWTPLKESAMYKRIIIPLYYAGEIVGYTARLVGDGKNKLIPRYIDKRPDHFITNLDRQQSENKKFVILTEGILDAYIVDGISPLGGSLTEEQINIINLIGKEIVVVPDRDNAGQELFNTAIEQGWSVSIPQWGKGIKDCAKAVEHYGRLLTLQSILECKETNKFAARLKRRMDKF